MNLLQISKKNEKIHTKEKMTSFLLLLVRRYRGIYNSEDTKNWYIRVTRNKPVTQI